MEHRFLLKNKTAEALYERTSSLPIIDYHNHVSVSDLASDRRFANLTELWLTPDPYKHRLMRICGVPEYFITGDAEPYEKFEQFATVFPRLAGNPVYDWSRMELASVFDIHTPLSRDTAKEIYREASERLSSPEYGAAGILSRFCVEYQSPVCALTDTLDGFDGKGLAPSLRADDLLAPTEALKKTIKDKTGKDDYLEGVGVLLDRFRDKGCRFADHALDAGLLESDTDGKKADMLVRLSHEYAKRDMTLLLHLDAKRRTSARLRAIAGPAGGYAAVGGAFPISPLCDLLNRMEEGGGLPDTLLFPLNMNDVPALAVLQGSFSEDGTPSKVGLGPAWWWCDHALGIKNTLSAIASFGVLSTFIGMTTDSRSILSFVRHDYFRRILASFLAEKNETEEWGLSVSDLGDIAQKICYENAKAKIGGFIC